MLLERFCGSVERVVCSAYVSLLCGIFGCISAAFLPFWSELGGGTHVGIFTLIENYYPWIMESRKIRVFRTVRAKSKIEWATDYYGFFTWVYGLGLAICLVNAVVSSVQACCLKSTSYRLCYASGCLGLISATSFTITMISFVMDMEDKRMGWALLLAFLSTVFIFLASSLYFIAGRSRYVYSRMPSNHPDEVL